MFGNQNYELYVQHLQQKRAINRIGNSVGGVMLINMVLTLILNLVIAIIMGFTGNYRLFQDAGFLLVLQILFSVTVLTLPPLLLPLFTGDRLKDIFMAKRVPAKTMLPLLMIGCGVSALANIGNNIFASFLSAFGSAPIGYDFALPDGVFGILLTFLSGAFFPALVEEFAMRGVLLGVLKKHFGNGTAILVSSILFGVMHGNLVQIPFAFLLGLYLGYITVYTHSIFPAVILHFINNFFSFALDMLTSGLGPTALSIISLLYFIIMLGLGLSGILLFTQSHDSMEVPGGETKKYTLALCKAPCIILYFVFIGLQVLDTQFGFISRLLY